MGPEPPSLFPARLQTCAHAGLTWNLSSPKEGGGPCSLYWPPPAPPVGAGTELHPPQLLLPGHWKGHSGVTSYMRTHLYLHTLPPSGAHAPGAAAQHLHAQRHPLPWVHAHTHHGGLPTLTPAAHTATASSHQPRLCPRHAPRVTLTPPNTQVGHAGPPHPFHPPTHHRAQHPSPGGDTPHSPPRVTFTQVTLHPPFLWAPPPSPKLPWEEPNAHTPLPRDGEQTPCLKVAAAGHTHERHPR